MGPDVDKLIELWADRDSAALRPAIDELESLGMVRVFASPGAASPRPEWKVYGVRGIVCVYVTEPLQQYIGDLEEEFR